MRIAHPTLAILALSFLAACGAGAPSVSSVGISGEANSSFAGKTPVTLQAAAKDASGNTITGKTFTWASSNPNIAEVDASGKVTPKHVGRVKISASADGIKGEVNFSVHGLEVIAGTAKYSDAAASTFLNLNYRVVLPGTTTTPDGTLSISGPAGFNAGAAQQIAYTGTAAQAGINEAPSKIAVAGAYTASTIVAGSTYTHTFSVDTGSVLPFASGVAISGVSASNISASWAAVPGAVTYTIAVREVVGGIAGPLIKPTVVTGTSGTISGLSLNSSKTYVLAVNAFNLKNNEDVLPGSFNFSYTATPITF